MKPAALILMSLVAGLAFAQDPASGAPSGASADETATPAAASDQSAPAQSAEQQASASQAEAADSERKDKVDLVALQRAGYKLVNQNGVQLFCKKEQILGSRLRFKTRCLTAAEIEQESFAAREAMNEASRKALNQNEGGGG